MYFDEHRNAEWCEKELLAGRPIRNQRIHLTRKIADIPGEITGCIITKDFEGYFMEGPEPEVAIVLDEHGIRPARQKQH